jgi:hypothetical protein
MTDSFMLTPTAVSAGLLKTDAIAASSTLNASG